MTKQRAIEIMQEHINTHKHQMTDVGYEKMVKMGLIKNTEKEYLEMRAYVLEQIEAYQLAIDALKVSDTYERNN